MRSLHTVVCAAALVAAFTAVDRANAETRVLYAEGFSPAASSTFGSQKPTQVQRVLVRAFGQSFPLQLEENSRLAAYIPAAARSRIGDLKVLRGSIEGRENSWVRLTLRNGRYEGAIWDGSELYGVEPRDALPADQHRGGGASAESLIYRASDIVNEGNAMTCGIGNEPIAGNALQQYKSFVSELQGAEALLASRDIEVAIVADYEYYARYGRASLETMISRMNMVDGIYATQLNVNIIPTEFTVFTSPDDPFDTTDAGDLLSQFANYRYSTPVIRSRGLAHLFTGRDLDGTTIGVAYLGSVCEPRTGVSLSEAISPVYAMLIIAHEIGHNFGAQHDGAPGACSTTPKTFLMAPQLNGSGTFSSCSIQTMQTFASSAACVTPARMRDVAVTVPESPVAAAVNRTFDYLVDVASVGEQTAYNIVTTASLGAFQVLSASMPGASSSINFGTVNCELPSLEPGETRRLTITARGTNAGTFNTRVSATASTDRNPANNSLDVPIQVYLSHAASITFTPMTSSVVVRSPFEVVAHITATGTEPLVDAIARIPDWSSKLSAASVDDGICARDHREWICQLGTLAPQQSRTIWIEGSATTIGYESVRVEVHAGTTPQALINTGAVTLSVTPQYDIAISQQGGNRTIAIGDVAELPVTITSLGSEAVPDARMTIIADARLTLQFAAPGVSCTVTGRGLDCELGHIAPGTSVNGILQASADTAFRTHIDFDIPQSVPDDYRSNNHFLRTLEVLPGSDVGVLHSTAPYTLRDGVSVISDLQFLSFGANAPSDVHATITLPESFTIHEASIMGGTCTVTGSTVACHLASMTTPRAGVLLSYTASELGEYTGLMEITAADDAVPSNNSAQLEFRVLPNVDARLVAPTKLETMVNEPVDLTLDVVNGRYIVANARLEIHLVPGIVVDSIRTSAATCLQPEYRVTCEFGTLAANVTTTVTLRIRATSELSSSLYLRFSSPDDVDATNNWAQVVMRADGRGDAVLTVGSTGGTATVNQRHTLSNIRVSAATTVHEAFIEFDFDPTRITAPQISNSMYPCDWTVSSARCSLGHMFTNSSHLLEFSFTPTSAGPLSIRMRVGARNETNPADNERTVTLNVQAAALPAPAGSGGSGGGGGGGGSMPASLLAALLCLALIRGAQAKCAKDYSRIRGR